MPQPPHVILCTCDQLRPFEMGCYGNPVVRTPHLDQLAREGVRFETAICNSPLCTPARSCLLSGQYARTCIGTTGCVGEPDPVRVHFPQPTLPEVLAGAGYHSSLIGKWHLQPVPELMGFEPIVYPTVPHRYTGRTYFTPEGPRVVPGFTWDFEMEVLQQFLARDHQDPFFLFFNLEPPHMPLLDAPVEYTGMYRPDEVLLRPNVWQDGELPWDEEWFRIYLRDYLYYREHDPDSMLPLPEGFDLRHLIAHYYGMATLLDAQVGRMMALLRASGLAEDTLVIFTSDHGDNLGSHGYFNKCRLIEESVRIPMIFWWPGQLQSGSRDRQLISLVDVMPSILGLLELPVPEHVEGQDVTPVIRGETTRMSLNHTFIEAYLAEQDRDPRGAVGIRTLDHLYGVALERGERGELFPVSAGETEPLLFTDLRADPYQMHNMAGTDEQAELATDLRRKLLSWMRQA